MEIDIETYRVEYYIARSFILKSIVYNLNGLMKIYIVVYDSSYQADNGIGKTVVGSFSTLEEARKCYTKTFLVPFFKKNKMSDYFTFDALKATTKKEWDDILSSFMESGSIEVSDLK